MKPSERKILAEKLTVEEKQFLKDWNEMAQIRGMLDYDSDICVEYRKLSEKIYSLLHPSLNEESEKKADTKEIIKKNLDYLKGLPYEQFVVKLSDKKTANFLSTLKSKGINLVKVSSKPKTIAVKNLQPTQSEIGMTNSLDYPLQSVESVKQIFAKNFVVSGEDGEKPIVTFNGEYIIDGHHRWSEAFIIDPTTTVKCMDFEIEGETNPIDALRDFQAQIAISGKVVSFDKNGINLLDKSNAQEAKKHIEDIIQDDVVNEIIKHVDTLKNKEDVVKYLCNNISKLPEPAPGAPERGYMPQTDTIDISEIKPVALDMGKN